MFLEHKGLLYSTKPKPCSYLDLSVFKISYGTPPPRKSPALYVTAQKAAVPTRQGINDLTHNKLLLLVLAQRLKYLHSWNCFVRTFCRVAVFLLRVWM